MAQPAPSPLGGADSFGEADLEGTEAGALESRTVYPPAPRERRESDIQELTVPPGERPSRKELPGSIEEAVLAVLDQIPRSASLPPRARPDDHDATDER